MTNVAQVLDRKADQAIYTISPDSTVFDAIALMASQGIGALVVTQQHQVVGIFSERDYTRKIILKERASNNTIIEEVMTNKVLTVSRAHTVEDCLQIMTDYHLRHLPVVEDHRLVGLISIGDLVKAAMQDQKDLIEQLRQYITG